LERHRISDSFDVAHTSTSRWAWFAVLAAKRHRLRSLLLEQLKEPIRAMCIDAVCLGLRASELAGLKWGDFDWGSSQVHIQRRFVIGHVDDVKTTNSNRSLPVHSDLARRLLDYKERTAPDAKNADCVRGLLGIRSNLEFCSISTSNRNVITFPGWAIKITEDSLPVVSRIMPTVLKKL
jgi:integrase